MSSPTNNKVRLETAKLADHSVIGGTFVALGSPLEFPSLGWIISSSLDVSVWVSTDGVENKILVLTGASYVLPFSALSEDARFSFPKGIQLYVKEGPDGSPSSGDIAITPIYGA